MKIYAVAKGRKTGIFETWDDCNKQVKGFSGALFKSFEKEEDALKYLKIHNVSHDFTSIVSAESQLENPVAILSKKRKNEQQIDSINVDVKKIKKDHYYKIYTDGSCTRNGYDDARAGIGVYFEYDQTKNISERITGKQTNNRAEVMAVIEALKNVESDRNIVVYSDSEYFLNCSSGKKKVYKNKELFDEFHSLMRTRSGKTKFEYVEGHSGNEDGNHFADQLAKKGARK